MGPATLNVTRRLLIPALTMLGLIISGSHLAANQSGGCSLRVNFFLVSKSEWLRAFQAGRYDFSALKKLNSITSGDRYHLLAHIYDEPAALNFACVVEMKYVAGETLTIGKHCEEFCHEGWGNSSVMVPKMKTYHLGSNGAGISVLIDELQFDFDRPLAFDDPEANE